MNDAAARDPAPADPAETLAPREALMRERARALEELRDTQIESPGPMTYGSQAAAASHVFEQQRDLALREHNTQHLAAIDEALARLDEGTYGVCRECHRPIAAERLAVLPWAAMCIDCQRSIRHR